MVILPEIILINSKPFEESIFPVIGFYVDPVAGYFLRNIVLGLCHVHEKKQCNTKCAGVFHFSWGFAGSVMLTLNVNNTL